ncbi:hypothetical protein HN419_03720 [Candidatus Woesearchaeota archaeon]|jgi:hypothetical protein|nr:hypothetical protein [Candidatus Woesearchaeota archaeon]MBT3538015.1 hypothetical protein [Candidatus Woesearchaeota archaeon]MBT4698106.1 hypothetical protein [Candidatus Woesearchaeota archaeon]MBT4717090.1 hypothetical protein [Candidatus Woesearchaeota archaeon]MBT7105684.1 hypothetical protein [Candidatus Woesearchaeota archaeon]
MNMDLEFLWRFKFSAFFSVATFVLAVKCLRAIYSGNATLFGILAGAVVLIAVCAFVAFKTETKG